MTFTLKCNRKWREWFSRVVYNDMDLKHTKRVMETSIAVWQMFEIHLKMRRWYAVCGVAKNCESGKTILTLRLTFYCRQTSTRVIRYGDPNYHQNRIMYDTKTTGKWMVLRFFELHRLPCIIEPLISFGRKYSFKLWTLVRREKHFEKPLNLKCALAEKWKSLFHDLSSICYSNHYQPPFPRLPLRMGSENCVFKHAIWLLQLKYWNVSVK